MGERIATLEVEVRELREDVRQLVVAVGDSRDPGSVRGRLHKIEGLIGSFVIRRSPGMILHTWERTVLVLCGIATAAAAWYAALGF